MQVILTTDVPHLGHMGDIIEVKDGFGRNYLIPQSLALQATKENQRQFDHLRRQVAVKSAQLRQKALGARETLEGVNITVARRTGGTDRLYGSVTRRDVADALIQQGYDIDRRQVELEEPIKELGIYQVPVKLHSDVSANVRVWVIRM
ncbi:MAG: 50S ribosomal protein L9 [Bradymonadales bacterium]|nr:50S ribosomal protein L9 [Bradymonadales bacterium]